MNTLLVHEQPRKREHTTISGKTIPSHWADAKATAFINPWDSWRNNEFADLIGFLKASMKFPSPNAATASKIPIREPTWGLAASKDVSAASVQSNADKIKTTWLGHACFLVELPNRSTPALAASTRGGRVLFDPVFSDRCSPSQWIGPKRFTKPPCKIEEIPEVDAVVISHNHYDHLDTHTIQVLAKRARKPHFFAPLGNGEYFKCLGIPDDHVHIMDWWDSKRITVTQPSSSTTVTMDITCTPAQHFTGRGVLDRFKTLWASWVVEEVRDPESTSKEEHDAKGVNVFFGGDTGYRAVREGQNEDEVPVCPAFKEIGETFGGFDAAMIPIGAYMPRWIMSQIHCAPQDSVRLFQDIKAKKAVGMHWGTWVLTSEDVLEPPKRLAEECKKVGLDDGAFVVCDIGETMFF